MVAQNCPRCSSSRIRRGYRPTPIWAKVLFRYNLLCDSCNWEFRGFAIPGTVTTKPPKKRKKGKEDNTRVKEKENSGETDDEAEIIEEKTAPRNKFDAIVKQEKKNKPNIESENQKKEKRVIIKL
jgi:hypothetical protein